MIIDILNFGPNDDEDEDRGNDRSNPDDRNPHNPGNPDYR